MMSWRLVVHLNEKKNKAPPIQMASVHSEVMRTGSYVTRLSDGRPVGFSGVLKLESDHLSIQPALFPWSHEWVQL